MPDLLARAEKESQVLISVVKLLFVLMPCRLQLLTQSDTSEACLSVMLVPRFCESCGNRNTYMYASSVTYNSIYTNEGLTLTEQDVNAPIILARMLLQ